MTYDHRGLVRFIPYAHRVEMEGRLDTYSTAVRDSLLALKLDTSRFEDYLEELLYGRIRRDLDD